MHPSLVKSDPLFSPRWRYDRVLRMIDHQPLPLKPTHYDDSAICQLRRLLLMIVSAGSHEAKQQAAIDQLPAVWQAFQWFYAPDAAFRYELEARLLTDESIEELATRYQVDRAAIESFETLFFDVRGRRQCRDW